jgi:cell division protein FtsW
MILKDEILVPAAVVGAGAAICIVIQKDLGSALILFAMGLTTFASAPNKWFKRYKHILKMALGVCLVAVAVVVATKAYRILPSHQAARFASWLEPTNSNYIYGSSYQVVNGLVGYTNGGLIGRGFNNSVMKYGYIPEAQNDYISAIITEEYGLVGIMFIILLYGVIIFRLIRYAFKIKDGQQKMTLVGIASYFFLHLFVNLGGVSGLIPMTGVPLLLVSAGGTSTIMALISIGMAQRIIMAYNKEELKKAALEDVS